MSRRGLVLRQRCASSFLNLFILISLSFIFFDNLPATAQAQDYLPSPLFIEPPFIRPQDRVTDYIDDARRVTLIGNKHPLATAQSDAGAVAPDYPMEHMLLTLLPDAAQEAALSQMVEAQQNPESPYYRQWLSPEQFAERYGVSDSDTAQVVGWLAGHGMEVEEVSAGRRSIIFSGSAGLVQEAFHTAIHTYVVGNEVHHANAKEPEIPAALAQVVGGVVALHDFRSQPAHGVVSKASNREYTSGGGHFLSPGDFATIYDVAPLYQQGINGSGQSIAIVARSSINIADVRQFRTMTGLPANDPQIIVNGADPGIWSSGEETEADLDVEWSGAVARNAAIKFVVSKSTNSSDGVDLSAQYIVNHNLAPVMSTSFGLCEASLGSSGNKFLSSLWEQAAAQGMTVLVSSGDNGAAGCDPASAATAKYGRAVNGICSTPYSICVGGTEFNDAVNPSLYWASTNSSAQESALSYIPEIVWNESGAGVGLWASGGGASTIYSKPAWQVDSGVPADGKRDVPDVALTAAGHDGYMIVQDGEVYVVGGTSAASPSFAGIVALVVEGTAARQGNANTVFYSLARNQRSGGAAVFHDILKGNNSVPGQTGFSATVAYDQTTGLGSVDASVLVNHWDDTPISPTFQAGLSATSVTVNAGSNNHLSVTVTVSGGFNAAVILGVSGLPTGVSAVFSPATLAAPGSGSSTLKLTATSKTRVGGYSITVSAASGATRLQMPLSLMIGR
jgi:pseudomonalisin